MVLVVTAMVGAIAGALSAQQFSLPMALGDAFVPDFYRRDLTAIDTELKLDAEQRAVVEALFADYDAEFRKRADAAREQMQALIPLAAIDESTKASRPAAVSRSRS
jgi:Spy/CpxP family protein refolding chaperone